MYWNRYGSLAERLNPLSFRHEVPQGRPLEPVILSLAFTMCGGDIGRLICVRLLGLSMLILFAWGIYRVAVDETRPAWRAACLAWLVVLTPPIALWAIWSTTLVNATAAVLGFAAGALCITAPPALGQRRYARWGLAMLLQMTAYSCHQSEAMTFLVPLALYLTRDVKRDEALDQRHIAAVLIVFALATGLYGLWYEAHLWPYHAPLSPRAALTTLPAVKAHVFVEDVLSDALSLWVVTSDDLARWLRGCCLAALLLGFARYALRRGEASSGRQVAWFLLLLPLSYLPNLLVQENAVQFHNQIALFAIVLIYLDWCLRQLLTRRMQAALMTTLCVGAACLTYSNVTYGFVMPHRARLEAMRAAIRLERSRQDGPWLVVRSMSPAPRRHEFGDTGCDFWVPDPQVNLLLTELEPRDIHVQVDSCLAGDRDAVLAARRIMGQPYRHVIDQNVIFCGLR